MKICIDAREVRGVITGLGRYALNLVRHIASIDKQNEYVVLRRASYPQPLVVQRNFTEIPVPYGISTVRNIFTGSEVVNPIQADIYHALFHLIPMGVRAKHIVVTLHDLIWVDHPDLSYDVFWRRSLVHKFVCPFIGKAITTADRVIAISESTGRAALARYKLPPDRFTVIHHGIDPVFCAGIPFPCLPEICRGRRFIFSLGNTRPYKNIPRLIHAFSSIVPQHPDLFLVISGRGDGYPSLVQLARNLGVARNVLFTTQLSDAEVRACYANAIFFAFPSLVEGFGFPVIEAMANGCPVLTSNTSSLPEIAGDSAVLVDPLNVCSIAHGILRLIEDPSYRQELADRGQQQASRFTWKACAEKTLSAYRNLMGAHRDPVRPRAIATPALSRDSQYSV